MASRIGEEAINRLELAVRIQAAMKVGIAARVEADVANQLQNGIDQFRPDASSSGDFAASSHTFLFTISVSLSIFG